MDKPTMASPLQLAYMGDAVCTLYVREHFLRNTTLGTHKLHDRVTAMVNAGAQAAALAYIQDGLTERELVIVRRGKNANSQPPRNCDRAAYRRATAYEALLGYLYLTEQSERLAEIMRQSILFWEENYAGS